MSSNDNVAAVRRPLTDTEMHTLLATIATATSTGQLLHDAVVGLFSILVADEGKTFGDFTAEHRLDPSPYAIPTGQWTAIVTAITARAAEWGTGAELSLTLIDIMPASYDDPTVAAS